MNWKKIRADVHNRIEGSRYYFSEQKDLILTNNIYAYKKLSVFCLVSVLLYTIITGILLKQWHITPYFIALLVISTMHIFVSFYINKHRLKNKTLEKACCVVFSLCVFIMLICVDTVATPGSSQVFSSAFLVVAPCIFIMNFSRMIIDQVFFVAMYWLFASHFKEYTVAVHDMSAILTGFVFGIILYAITMDLRLQVNVEVIRLKHFSEIDELTNINNRREANTRITYLLERKATTRPCALMMLDVDFFKRINDTHGHKVGDQVLVEVAKVLASSFRKTDVVSRFGGDEFMVFMTDFGEGDFLPKKCQDIQAKVRNILKDQLSVSCSIGVCELLSGSCTMDELVVAADKALYETKEREKGTYTISTMRR